MRSARSFSLIGIIAAIVLTGLSPGVASATERQMAPISATSISATTATSEIVSRPDAVAAMTTARATGERVEDLSQSDEYTRVYANPDGTWTGETAPTPVQIRDSDGGWHDIDTTLVDRDGGLAPAYTGTDLTISDGGDMSLATMTADGRDLNWYWPYKLPTPTVDGNTATYHDALPGVGDLVVTATATGFAHNLVLTEPPADPITLTIPISTDGAELNTGASGSISVETHAGDTLVTAAAPLMWDSSSDQAGEPDVAQVDTSVGETGSGIPTLTLSPDDGFLQDPDTVYPVTIDPSYGSTQNATGDVWVQNADYTTGQTSSDQLRAGTYDGGTHKARSFMHFDTNRWNGKDILSARLVLRNWYSGSCSGGAIRASRVSSTWDGTTLTWANQPDVGGTNYDDFSAAYGYNASCDTGDATWNVKNMVQDWASGNYDNNGIRLKAVDETNNATWRKYRSANYGGSVVPHIEYTYNSYPDKPKAPQVATDPVSSSGYSRSLTPTLKASVSDSDRGTVRADFEVYQGSTLKWSGSTSYVASGQVATKSVPPGILTDGTTYTVKLRADDGTDQSKSYSASTTFKVDTTKPTVSVAASNFLNGLWTANPPSSNSFTFNGPTDASAFAYSLDGVTATPVKADANGDASIAWLPTAGLHTVAVTATDLGGNVGPATSFKFGVGPASFTAPSAGARTTGSIPLSLTGPANAANAYVLWRFAGGSTWNAASGITKGGGSWDGSVTSDGTASTSGNLLWDATEQELPGSTGSDTVSAPALLELRTCFNYAGTTAVCSSVRQVQLVPSAFGGNFPQTTIGPASVALHTGEMAYSDLDAIDTSAGVGRTFSSFDPATSGSGPFGPGWSTQIAATGADSGVDVFDNRAQDRTIVLVSPGGGSQIFTPTDVNADVVHPTGAVTFWPAGTDDGSRLVLDGDSLTLARPQAGMMAWTSSGENWILESAASELGDSDPETTLTFSKPGYPTWIAQTLPGDSATCTEAVQDQGCRGLKFIYSGTGDNTRLVRVDRLVASASPVTIAAYTYTGGLLTSACGSDPDGTGPLTTLCNDYSYDSASVSGRTLLKTVTPPGQASWTFAYNAEGQLTSVTRPADPVTTAAGGAATWSIVYDLSTTASGLPDLSPAAATRWGQLQTPTRVAAVFTPEHVASSTPTSSDLAFAKLWYTTDDGSVTNTAVQGNVDGSSQWLVDSVWYDGYGNVVRGLDAAGRAKALASDPADQSQLALESSYLTRYNDDGDEDHADGDGVRVEDEFGPAHAATLKDGTVGSFRVHTAYIYDDEAPALGGPGKPAPEAGETSLGLVVETDRSAATSSTLTDFDTVVVRNEYAPIVAGDANGWELGEPTKVSTKLADGSWSTITARYDNFGREVETRQPGGGAATDGSGNDAHTTVTSYYAPGAVDPDCNTTDYPARSTWEGLTCKTGPGGQPTGPNMPVTYYSSYNDTLLPTETKETSGSTTRTTTTSYDAAGRPLTRSLTDGSDTRSSTVTYDQGTGLPVATTSSSGIVATKYDSWGRVRSYTDSGGMVSELTYTIDGQVATRSDGSGTYTYGYDGPTGEHRRLLTSVDTGFAGGVPGEFSIGYNADSSMKELTYPNGLVATYGYDDGRDSAALEYADGAGTTLMGFTASEDVNGKIVGTTSPSAGDEFDYDPLGRLVEVRDTQGDGCTTRTYGFNADSSRASMSVYFPDASGACQKSVVESSKTNTYDAAGRIRNAGYAYDALGRTLTVPSSDVGSSGTAALTATYYANDMIKSVAQSIPDTSGVARVQSMEYGLDPEQRISSITTKVAGTETERQTYGYADGSDNPTVIRSSTNGGSTWSSTRYVTIPGLGMVASQSSTGVEYQLCNMHGDVVATSPASGSGIDSYNETDEYGNDKDAPNPSKYAWLGAEQRSGDSIGSLILMGARIYNSQTGAFLSPDPVLGGNLTRYGYPEDPVGASDVSGMASSGCSTDLGCDAMWDACRDHGNYLRCKFLFYLLKHDLDYSTSATTNPNWQNAGRHFAFMVISALLIGVDGARAVGAAHEEGSPDPVDKTRDVLNNSYSLGWFQRHTGYAKDLVGRTRTTGDIEKLFWHGVDLFQRGYMYGVCKGEHRRITQGPCT